MHRAFGEPLALLAGDALIVEAFRELADASAPAAAIGVLARAAGASGGLVSGQAMELDGGQVDVTAYHAAKTGTLFEAAAVLGAISVGVSEAPFVNLGRRLGALYQVADDVADAHGDASVLGKPVGRDTALHRPSAAATSREAARATLLYLADELRRTAAGLPELRSFVNDTVTRVIERALA